MTKRKRNRCEPEESRHHKLAKSRGGRNDAPNNEKISHDVHKAIHKVFGNKYTLEKIEQIITMDEAILTDYFRRIIIDVLKMDYKDVVVREAFRNKKLYNDFPETKQYG